MRGKAFRYTSQFFWYGITPAHAGKSYVIFPILIAARDHPRTCGEKNEVIDFNIEGKGSPPHMRGKEDAQHAQHVRRGITPAHAGKSLKINAILHGLWDHPRTCGEKCAESWHTVRYQGSPPHMRGKALFPVPVCGQTGITPAHAGKSPASQGQLPSKRDHPRTCGEKLFLVSVRL